MTVQVVSPLDFVSSTVAPRSWSRTSSASRSSVRKSRWIGYDAGRDLRAFRQQTCIGKPDHNDRIRRAYATPIPKSQSWHPAGRLHADDRKVVAFVTGNCTAILPFAGDAKARFGHTALHNVVVGQKLACSIDGKGGADAGALTFGGSGCERGRRWLIGKRVAGHRRARDAVFA